MKVPPAQKQGQSPELSYMGLYSGLEDGSVKRRRMRKPGKKGKFHAGAQESKTNSHMHRKERGESSTLGRAMKSSANTTNTPPTRVLEIDLIRWPRGGVSLM